MKKINILSVFFVAIVLLLINACGGNSNQKNNDESLSISGNDVITDLVVEVAEEESLDISKGEALFKTKCMVCHQESGLGIPGSFPPLAGSDYLLADKKRAFLQVQNGSKIPLTINGVEYPGGIMPPQELSPEETIEVLNYVYNSWGNDGGKVTLEDVQ